MMPDADMPEYPLPTGTGLRYSAKKRQENFDIECKSKIQSTLMASRFQAIPFVNPVC